MAFSELQFFSKALGKRTTANVILPEVGEPPYPTLYLLHGLSDDQTMWMRNTSIERYVANLPLIVVMPDGGRGFYLDAKEGFAYGSAIGTELPERIERTFPAKKTRAGRALAGLSMGGYGATQLALTNPERFCAAASFSGALGFGHDPKRIADLERAAEWIRILGRDYAGGGNADLYHLLKTVPAAVRPALRIDCGVDDFLIDDNRKFHAYAESLDIPHEYVEYPGAHNWAYWDAHVQDALPFLCEALGIAPIQI